MRFDEWMGWAVPVRDDNRHRHRRVVQGDEAMEKLDRFILAEDERGVCVQAGGNWGYWPRRLSDIFKTVYTFEPDPVCFAALVANTAMTDNVIRLQAALGYDRNLVGLHRSENSTGNQHVDGAGIYPTLRIDDLNLMECDLIYLDIEGSEHTAVEGARKTIKRCRPIVIFEERQSFGANAEITHRLLADHGYEHVGAIGADIVMRHE